jgi:hypothetical protein
MTFSSHSRRAMLLGFALVAASVLLGCGTSSERGRAVVMQDVQSSALRSVGYDGGQQTLVITFQSGSTYEYGGVPRKVYEELMRAPSKGTYFNAHVKGQYSYRRTR